MAFFTPRFWAHNSLLSFLDFLKILTYILLIHKICPESEVELNYFTCYNTEAPDQGFSVLAVLIFCGG